MQWGQPWGQPWGLAASTVDYVVARGQDRILCVADGSWPVSLLSPANWLAILSTVPSGIAAGSDHIVADAWLDGDDPTRLVLQLDRSLLEGWALDLTALDTWFSGDPIAVITFDGVRASVPDPSEPAAVLVDVDSPIIREGGEGGDYTITSVGDYKLTGGLDTLRKLVWRTLLTIVGELWWRPDHGFDLRHKGPAIDLVSKQKRIRTVLGTLPHVDNASVALELDGDHLIASVSVQSRLGQIDETRRITP